MHRFPLSLLVLALPLLHANAQEQSPPAEPTPHLSPALGIHYGSPLRISFSLGVMADVSTQRNDGVIVMAEAGQQGNEISAGYFRTRGRYGSGYSLRAAVVRTGDEPWEASPHTTYAGVEGQWMLLFGVGGRLGYLRRVSRSVLDPHDNVTSFGLSIGW